MKALLDKLLHGKSVVILGYGREGQSTFKLLRKYFPLLKLTIADADETISNRHSDLQSSAVKLNLGKNYLDRLNEYDVIIKSPGISLAKADVFIDTKKITSQADIFLQAYSNRITGITGTKGKSTTASLIYHIYKKQSSDAVLLGNIGLPFFDALDSLTTQTRIVCELSSHQLEYISVAPHVSILTNIFEEHLDHYASFAAYQQAKFQIALKQKRGDYFIYSSGDERIAHLLSTQEIPGLAVPVHTGTFSNAGAGILDNALTLKLEQHTQKIISSTPPTRLLGTHNLQNIYMAAVAAHLSGISSENIANGIEDFQPLEHRLEYCETAGTAQFYNDSISTIPEATLAALASLKNVYTLIAGGYDRGIDYSKFAVALSGMPLKHILLTGPAGRHIYDLILSGKKCVAEVQHFERFDDAVYRAISITPANQICLLSPAASSYDQFSSFEERGKRFKQLVK